ncbi:MAG: hypothetical protein KBG15_08250 [Kofleriaceae bacterium]|nr:hypothetical protein [Kofleriaceae bacterium]
MQDDLRTRGSRIASVAGKMIPVFVVLLVLLAGGIYQVRGCNGDETRALRIIKDAGYRDVTLTGPAGLRCGGGISNGFLATGPTGQRVDGVVCCSMTGCGKACTIRFK